MNGYFNVLKLRSVTPEEAKKSCEGIAGVYEMMAILDKNKAKEYRKIGQSYKKKTVEEAKQLSVKLFVMDQASAWDSRATDCFKKITPESDGSRRNESTKSYEANGSYIVND